MITASYRRVITGSLLLLVLAISHADSSGRPNLQAEAQRKAESQQGQETPGGKGGTPGRTGEVSGRVVAIDRNAAKIVVESRQAKQEVLYNKDTRVTNERKAASIDEVREGRYVVVVGRLNDKKQFEASGIDMQPAK